jgi:hypothetical protein
MSSSVHGDCTLTATTDAPYYLAPTRPVSIVVKSRVVIMEPLTTTNWNYSKANTAQLVASSARPFISADGLVEVRCSYRGIENFAHNFSVVGEAFTVDPMEGFGSCLMRTFFNETVFVNADRQFYSKAPVTLTVTGTARKLIDRLTKRLLGRK